MGFVGTGEYHHQDPNPIHLLAINGLTLHCRCLIQCTAINKNVASTRYCLISVTLMMHLQMPAGYPFKWL